MLTENWNTSASTATRITIKKNVANKFAELVYDGKWFSPLREALSAFVDETQKTVTGQVH